MEYKSNMAANSSEQDITPVQLSESIQDAFRAIAINQPRSFHPKNKRRSSLPCDQLSSLKRTISHKSFPHLAGLRGQKSTPFHFSPATNLDATLHLSRSHCNLPHLPGGSNGTSKSLSPPSSFVDRVAHQRQRRQSYPLDEEATKQLHLHRCKAIQKANITLEDVVRELNKASELVNSTSSIKRAKSEPILRALHERIDSIHKDLQNHLSKSSHECPHVHHIDSRFLSKSRSGYKSSRDVSVLNQISENLIS